MLPDIRDCCCTLMGRYKDAITRVDKEILDTEDTSSRYTHTPEQKMRGFCERAKRAYNVTCEVRTAYTVWS